MNLFGKTLAAMLVAGSAILVGSATAGEITQTFTQASTAVPYTYNFSANQFNTSDGTLNSVVITIGSNVVGEVDVFNSSGSAESFTNATASVPVTLTGPAGLDVSTTATTPAISGTANPGPNAFPGQMTTVSESTTLSSGFSDYIGTGTISQQFSFNAGSGTFAGSGSNTVFFSGSASADATITIVYNFTALAVPEPSSIVLLGMGGVFGLFGWRTFRRRTA